MCALASHQDATFTSRMREEFARHRGERTRSWLFETLGQRGLTGRLDALSRAPRPTTNEILTCAAATTGVLTEWALKLHTGERWSVARNAISLIDDFAAALLAKVKLDLEPCNTIGLARFGTKIRGSRDTLCRALRDSGGRRPVRGQIFGRTLDWIYTMHTRLTSSLLVDRTIAGRLPTELINLVGERMVEIDHRHFDHAAAGMEEYAKEESRLLARAGVARLESSRRAAVRA